MVQQRIFRTMVLMVALAFIMSGCSPAVPAPTPTPLPMVTVRFAYPSASTWLAPVVVADEEGYFAEQGIEIEWVHYPSAGASLPVMAQGQLDAGVATVQPGIHNAVIRGMPIKYVASMSDKRPEACAVEAMVVRKDLYDSGEVRTVADWRGKRVAVVQEYSPIHYSLVRVLESAGLTEDDIRLIVMPVPDTIAALKSGDVDVAFAPEPLLTLAQDLGLAVPLVNLNEWNEDGSFIMFGPTLLEKDRELGKRFMVAYLKGARQFAEGKTPRNVEILAKFADIEKELVERQCWPIQGPNGTMDLGKTLEMQDWFFERGVQDQKATAEQLMDASFLEYALGVLGKVE
jgi:ABC-type nitrate/sulfonate/bicarbonate transport system substrate-binding protein